MHKNSAGKSEDNRLLWRPRSIWRIILKCTLKKYSENISSGLIYIRIESSGGLL
jgi:hypothetical protein